jgi:hypothetical protein
MDKPPASQLPGDWRDVTGVRGMDNDFQNADGLTSVRNLHSQVRTPKQEPEEVSGNVVEGILAARVVGHQ